LSEEILERGQATLPDLNLWQPELFHGT